MLLSFVIITVYIFLGVIFWTSPNQTADMYISDICGTATVCTEPPVHWKMMLSEMSASVKKGNEGVLVEEGLIVVKNV